MSRFERKFIINLEEYQKLKALVQLLGICDSHSLKKDRYPVFSQYFDTKDLRFYYEKIEGLFEHSKIRIRTYGSRASPSSKTYLEAKIKRKAEQFKLRIPEIQKGRFQPGKDLDFLTSMMAEERMVGTCNIYYEREAYQIPDNSSWLRVNFDHNVCCLPPSEKEASLDHEFKHCLDDGQSILMEVKGLSHDPSELMQWLLKGVDTRAISFSKYIWGIEHLSAL